jgi:tetratricopeptide (TPR) repeat protein
MMFGIMEVLSLLSDDHTGLWVPGSAAFIAAVEICPLGLYPFADGIHVAYADRKYAALVGKKVVRIGKVTAEEAITRLARLANGDNEAQKRELARIFLASPEMLKFCGVDDRTDALRLTLQESDGSESVVAVAPEALQNSFANIANGPFPGSDPSTLQMNSDTTPPALWLRHGGDAYWFDYQPASRTMYLRLKAMEPKQEEGFPAFFERFFAELDKQPVDRLVIDVRNNAGGDHHEMPLLKGILARAQLDRPDRLFVIINRGVGSAAQHFANIFAQYTNATFVGEPTGTRPNFYGARRNFSLPNHKGVVIAGSNKVFQEWDSDNYELRLVPRFDASLTAADFQANRDAALDFVLRFDDAAAAVRDAEQRLHSAGVQGAEAVIAAYEAGKPALVASHANLETFMLDFDNRFVFKDAAAEAAFLAVAVRDCPESLVLRHRLGLYLRALGRTAEARECQQECLRRNPGHRNARVALEMMDLQGAPNRGGK